LKFCTLEHNFAMNFIWENHLKSINIAVVMMLSLSKTKRKVNLQQVLILVIKISSALGYF